MDRIDDNDLAHVLRLGLKPVASQPCPWGGNGGINPHLTRFTLSDGRMADVFHVKPVYYETPEGFWRPLSEVAAHHGNHRIVLRADAWGKLSLRYLRWLMARQRLLGSALEFEGLVSPERLEFAATLTAYPDPSPETTTVDGSITYTDSTWALTQGAATGTASDSSTTFNAGVDNAPQIRVWRAFTLFDTSALTGDVTVSAAVASLYVTVKINTDDDGDDWVNVVQSNPASNTALASADYSACGDAVDNPTEGATRIDVGSITTSAYNDWALDATGLGWVSLTGVTKLGWREGHDCIDSAPAGENRITVSSADASGTSQDPKLVVTYTPSAQELAPGLLTNSQTFYAPTVSATYALTPGLFTNTQAFYAPTVAPGAVSLSPPLLTNGQSFFDVLLTTHISLAPPLFTNDQTFYAATVSPGAVTLQPSLVTNESVFYGPTAAPGAVDLSPPLLTNTSLFYGPTATPGAVTLSPSLVTNDNTFYGPSVSKVIPSPAFVVGAKLGAFQPGGRSSFRPGR